MTAPVVLAVDQGTTNTKALVVGQDGETLAAASVRVGIEFPQPGWVQSDAGEIWDSVRSVIGDCLRNVPAGSVVGLGISNQRESVVAWERASGAPLGPVVSWQCGRGAARCAALGAAGHGELVAARTGLVLDPMFAATKMAWLLDAIDDGHGRAARGEICLGTIDSWLVWNLTGGRSFVTDLTNASRTLLFDLAKREWDDELLAIFGIPPKALPRLQASASPFGDASVTSGSGEHHDIPIWAVAGDSHAALVGHRALAPGTVKATFGTGSSIMAPVDVLPHTTSLSSTIAWSRQAVGGNEVVYAIEGNVYATGSALEWVASLLGFGGDVGRLNTIAAACDTSGGVCFVPALSGLGAPYWDSSARGLITGLTRAAGPPELARAAFEAVAHQVTDVLDAVQQVLDSRIEQLHVDGGAMRSELLAQLLADLAAVRVVRSDEPEVAALGAAFLAGSGAGLWPDLESTASLPVRTTRFEPALPDTERRAHRSRWADAVRRTLTAAP